MALQSIELYLDSFFDCTSSARSLHFISRMPVLNYRQSHETCKNLTSQYAKSFYWASHVLPQAKRRAAYSIYSFYRFAKDGIHKAQSPAERMEHIKKCESLIQRIYDHRHDIFGHPLEVALEQTVARYEIPKSQFDDFLTGLVLDSHVKQPADESELLKYCYYIAGTVGLMAAQILDTDKPSEEEAFAMGTAMRLTNLSRNIREDALNGRVYLPQDWLQEAGLTYQNIIDFAQGDNLHLGSIWKVQCRMVRLAEDYAMRARPGVMSLTEEGSRLCVSVVMVMYRKILGNITKRGPHGLLKRQKLNVFEALTQVPQVLAYL